jgi:hypothetical protein
MVGVLTPCHLSCHQCHVSLAMLVGCQCVTSPTTSSMPRQQKCHISCITHAHMPHLQYYMSPRTSNIMHVHELPASCRPQASHIIKKSHVLRCTSILNHHMTTIILEPFEGRRDLQTTCLTTTSDIVHSMLPFTNTGSDNWCQNPRKPFAVAPHLYGAFLELSCHKFKTSQTKGFILHLRAGGRARWGGGGMLEILWFK